MKKLIACFLAAAMALSATACSSGTASSSQGAESKAADTKTSSAAKSDFKVSMVTDTGGVNDQSFNQSSWEGLQKLKTETGANISYMESKQESDYATNLDKAVDGNNKLVWGIGYAMANAVLKAAKENPDINFAIVDNAYDQTPPNLTGVVFRAQEPSFLVGYIAAKTTKTNKVGFVGGSKSAVIDQFEWGYKAGVAYGAKEMNKKVSVVAQYAESFSDSAKGKAITSKMYASDGCDIVFHAAGNVGTGVIEAAKEAKKYAIGVDKDQAYLAPDNVLTSALKLVNKAVDDVSKKVMNGEKVGGTTVNLGLTEDAVGIPTEHKLMGDATYNSAIALEQQIKDKKIVPPATEKDYNAYVKTLNK